MGLIAGLLAQNLLKYFLNFGEVAYLQSYNALLNFFDNQILSPNPECNDECCIQRQKEFQENKFPSRKPIKKEIVEEKIENIPITNEWGITIACEEEESASKQKTVDAKENEMSLDDLKNQLGGMFGKKK